MPAEPPIILTGAASGIGRAAAEQLAAKSRVLALVDVHADGLHQVVATCQRHSPRTRGFGCDVANQSAVERIYGNIRDELGAAGILINCAGIGRFAPFLEIEPAEWERMFRVNVMGTLFFTRAVLPGMLAAGEGLIINVSSRMAIDPHPNTTAYAATQGSDTRLLQGSRDGSEGSRDQSDSAGSGGRENKHRHAKARRLSRSPVRLPTQLFISRRTRRRTRGCAISQSCRSVFDRRD